MSEESTKTAVGASSQPWVGALSSEVEETWEPTPSESPSPLTDGITMDVDIACVGFGPAMGGFLSTLTQEWSENPGDPALESKVLPGSPIQVLCFERADDLAAGVSGVVTRARGIRTTFPNLRPEDIPMAAAVKHERVLYLLDPVGASRRSAPLRFADFLLRLGRGWLLKDHAFELPWT